MTTVMITNHAAGKAPVLTDDSPQGITRFLKQAKAFFLIKGHKEDETKILILGSGLGNFPELENWYTTTEEEWEGKSYSDFVTALQRRALPRDYVWEARRKIRETKQGSTDFEDWIDDMRTLQLQLTTRVLSDRDFIEHLLYNMDPELCSFLRRGTSLQHSGFHEDDLSKLAFVTTKSTAVSSCIDFEEFSREARDEWSRISTRRRSNLEQIRSLAKKTNSISISNKISTSTSSRSNSPATTSTTTVRTGSASTNRPAKLTDLEKDWLTAVRGCFKCREWNLSAGHSKDSCLFPRPGHVVKVPTGWDKSKPVPSLSMSSTTSNTATVGIRALQEMEEEEEESFEFGTETESDDTDGCAFPPLSVKVGLGRRSKHVFALADSGSSISVISNDLVKELGLVRRTLCKPKRFKVAIQGKEEFQAISEYVRLKIELTNGTWSSRESTFLVAPLSPPFDIILGVPFMRQEEMSLAVSPDMQVIVPNPAGGESLDLLAPSSGPLTRIDTLACMDDDSKRFLIASLIAESKEALETDAAEEEELERLSKEMMVEFADVFPDGLPKLTDDYLAKTKTRHRIKLIDPNKIQNQKMFSSPRKWQEAWKRDLERALDNGRLRPSTSPYASACFVIPKKNGKLRWVNDYRILNANTVKDRTPVPDVDQILYAAADAQFWASIDCSDAFWQTPMHEDDIEKTAIKTPWGLFEWTVMPQGLCNAPATHQARINEALRHLIGVCCAAFVDDIIIFSKTLEEHKENVSEVLKALRKAGFYGSPNKTKLFTTRTKFLGHGISRKGISVDDSKVQKIKEWERPKTVTQVRGFLGMVQYLRKFIPRLAEFTSALTPLTRKGMTQIDHLWTEEQEKAFVGIKKMITSLPVLKPVRHDSDEPIWLMTDASKVGIGAVLLQGEDWKTAHPCGFWSRQYIAAEKNYPTHEQELLAVVGAMKAWRIELLGCKFRVLTDHDTLRHFKTQPTLSRRQARWMELLADYDYELSYIPGKMNTVADSLSRFSFPNEDAKVAVCGISEVSLSSKVVEKIVKRYADDPFVVQVRQTLSTSTSFSEKKGLIYFEGSRIVIPDDKEIRGALLHDSHDALGHYGAKKTIKALSKSFYWPTMAKEVEAYVTSCDGCQRAKARTTKKSGQLHSLPVPSRPFSDVALDFVGPLPESEGKDMLLTMTDRLTGYTRLLPCRARDGAKEIAEVVFRGWFCLFGIPERLVSDRDKLFTSKLWSRLHKRMGIKLQMSTSFHPETDGRSERSNKTAVQILRQYVARNQKDWVKHLSTTEYAINTAVNVSTGAAPFEVVLGFLPSIHSLPTTDSSDMPAVEEIVVARQAKVEEVRDQLAAAKVRQATQANRRRGEELPVKKGDFVMVDSQDRRARYKSRGGDVRAAKLFPRWDGPYEVLEVFDATSTFKLKLPENDRAHPTFHASKLKLYRPNDADQFPDRTPARPEPIDVDGEQEFVVEAILDERKRRNVKEYLVKWAGYPAHEATWEARSELEETEALDRWEKGEKGD